LESPLIEFLLLNMEKRGVHLEYFLVKINIDFVDNKTFFITGNIIR